MLFRIFFSYMLREQTISDILWNSHSMMTAHYSVGQVRELLDALNLITYENYRMNASLKMPFREYWTLVRGCLAA